MGTIAANKRVEELKTNGYVEIAMPEGAETAQSGGIYMRAKNGKVVTISHAGDVIECKIVRDSTKGMHRPFSPNPVKEP